MSVKVVVRLGVLALVPVTVIVDVPGAAPAAAVIVTVVEQVGLQVAAENVAVTPAGSADSEKATGCVVPLRSVAVMVVVPEAPPAVTVTVVGLTASVNDVLLTSGGSAAATVDPFTVIVKSPVGVAAEVVSVSTLEHVGLQEGTEKFAATPAGSGD